MELDLDNLIERVQSTHSQYLEEKERFNTELTAAQAETAKVTTELVDANTKIERLTGELETAKRELLEKSSELENTTSKEEVDQILNNDAAVYKELHNKYEALKEKHASEVEAFNKTIEELNKNAENFETYSNSLKEDIKESSTALANLQNKYADLENQKKDLDIAFLELKEKHNKSIENDANTDVKVSELEKCIEDQKKALENANIRYDNLKTKTLGTIRHLVEDVIEPNEARFKELLAKEDAMKNSVSEAEHQSVLNQNNELNTKIKTLTQDLATKDARIVELTQTISKLTEEVKSLTPVRQTHTHLQDYIDSTIPIPEGTAAATANRPVRSTKELESNVVNTPFGMVTPELITSATKMIDKLYENRALNPEGNYSLNNALQAAEDVGLSVSTGNIIMDRLCSMSKNGKPLVFFNGNVYYATIDKEELKSYILKG